VSGFVERWGGGGGGDGSCSSKLQKVAVAVAMGQAVWGMNGCVHCMFIYLVMVSLRPFRILFGMKRGKPVL